MELKYFLACVIRPILINKKLTVAIVATLLVIKLFTALLLSRNSTHSPIDTAFLNLNAENIELNTDLKVSDLLELIYVVLNFFVYNYICTFKRFPRKLTSSITTEFSKNGCE